MSGRSAAICLLPNLFVLMENEFLSCNVCKPARRESVVCSCRPYGLLRNLCTGILRNRTVTELIAGVRETYLKKTTNYAVNPQSVLYALHGQGVHAMHEQCTEGDMLSEIRLKDTLTSGKFDLYGKIIDDTEGVLG